MSKFTSALVVSPLSDGKSWVLLDEFSYHVGTENSSDVIDVSKGFATDFTSVPRVFWWLIPRWGKYGNAAVIHDWLYWQQKTKSRREADDILLEGMSVLGVSGWRKTLIYYAVRYFGWLAWFRNTVDRENGFNRVVDVSGIKATKASERPGTTKSALTYFKNKKKNKGQ